jgi:hypothetical protein
LRCFGPDQGRGGKHLILPLGKVGAGSGRCCDPGNRAFDADGYWSLTVYDAETRAEIVTDQHLAALWSLVELTPDRIREDATEVHVFRPRTGRRCRRPFDQDHSRDFEPMS